MDLVAALAMIRQSLFSQSILSAFLALLLWTLSKRQKGQAFHRAWAIGWAAYALYAVTAASSLLPYVRSDMRMRNAFLLVAAAAAALHALSLVFGASTLLPESAARRNRRIWLAALLMAPVIAGAVYLSEQIADRSVAVQYRNLPRLLLTASAYGWCALTFWRQRSQLGVIAAPILIGIMGLWSLEQAIFSASALRMIGTANGWPLALLPNLTTAVGTQFSQLDFTWLAGMASGLMLAVLAASDRDRLELARTTSAYRTLVESSPSAIVTVANSGRIELANLAAHQLFGWPLDAPDLVPPEPRRNGTIDDGSPWRKALAGERLSGIVGDVVRPDGETVVISLAVAPIIESDGRVAGAIGVATDLTGQRRLEAELRHAQKMEAVGRLAGGIAHDFNNLLTAMLGSLHLLEDEIDEAHPAAETVDEIRAAAVRAADLTGRLLGFSRRERRAPVPLDLDALLTDFRKLLRRVVDEHVEIELDLAGALPLVIADPGELEQVVTNLCVNARDAMQDTGGTIVIRTAEVDVRFPLVGLLSSPGTGRFVRLDIADTGAGMDEATLSRMFEPFYTTKVPGKGTGLGLATVYAIIEETGGQLRVESTPGSGTVFSLFLRAA